MDRKVAQPPIANQVYCTILTKSRVYQGLALLDSLKKVTSESFQLYILCIEIETFQLLKKFNDSSVVLISENILEEEVIELKKQRKTHEYCWTLKPILIEYLLLNNPSFKRVTYLDSDLFFWKDPGIIFANQPNCSVLLSPEEKYRPNWKRAKVKKLTKVTGKFNSGFISFKQDQVAHMCVKWWKIQCISRCEINPPAGYFGDQKYLDQLPGLSPSVCSITLPGVNIGPWNLLKYNFLVKDDEVYIDDDYLIFYHFSSFRVKGINQFKVMNKRKNQKMPFIYKLYKKRINKFIRRVQKLDSNFTVLATPEDLKKYW